MWRFSLASLFLLIALVAVGCAALKYANSYWQQGLMTATVAFLMAASVAWAVSTGSTRAFACGAALVGWIYLLLCFVPALGLREKLLTDRALAALSKPATDQSFVQAQNAANLRTLWAVTDLDIMNGSGIVTGSDIVAGTVASGYAVRPGRSGAFNDIGHCLWTLLLAFIAGVLACYAASRSRKKITPEQAQ